jgi:acyl carrier protein
MPAAPQLLPFATQSEAQSWDRGDLRSRCVCIDRRASRIIRQGGAGPAVFQQRPDDRFRSVWKLSREDYPDTEVILEPRFQDNAGPLKNETRPMQCTTSSTLFGRLVSFPTGNPDNRKFLAHALAMGVSHGNVSRRPALSAARHHLIRDIVFRAVAETSQIHGIVVTSATRILEDLGLGEFGRFRLTLCIEDAFNIDLPDDPIRHLRTVGDIVTFLSEQARGAAGLSAASHLQAA